jgi:hypothetical protein
MILQASENEAAGVERNISAAIEAAHEAIWAFFKLWAFFETEAAVWWVFQHRAFEESLLIAHLLSSLPPEMLRRNSSSGRLDGDRPLHSLYAKARDDVQRMLELMERYGHGLEMHRTRKDALREAFEKIGV